MEQLSIDRARDRVQRKIGIIEDLAVGGRVEGVIANAAESAPNIELSVVADSSQVVEDEFKAGRFDLMLGNQIDEWPGLRARRRGTLKLIWAASPSFDVSVRPLPMALCKAPSNWRDRVIERLNLPTFHGFQRLKAAVCWPFEMPLRPVLA